MQGLMCLQFRYDQLPAQPIQLQAGMSYRIISRQPLKLSCSDFNIENITDEMFKVSGDNRLLIDRHLSLNYFSEYVVIIGYPNNIIYYDKIGFNHKISFSDLGHYFWNAGDSEIRIPCSDILGSPYYSSKVNLFFIDEIIAHRYELDTPDSFNSGGVGMGINSCVITDLNDSDSLIILNNKYVNFRIDDLTKNRCSSLFHWKANTHEESILFSLGENNIKFRNVVVSPADNPFFLTVKGRIF